MADWTPPEVSKPSSDWTPPEVKEFTPPEVAKPKEKGMLDQAGDFITGAAEKLTTGVNLKKILEKPVEAVTSVPGFERDVSKVGQVPASEYLQSAKSGAKTGAVIGGIAGGIPIVGAGIIPGAAAGAVTGGVGGLFETWAKDLGYKEDFQTLANLVGGGFTTNKALNAITKNKLANDAIQRAEGFALDMLPKIGIARKFERALGRFAGEERIPAREIEKATGQEVKTVGTKLPTDPTSEVYKFNQELQQQAKVAKVGDLYENTKGAYDQAVAKAPSLDIVISQSGKDLPKSSLSRIKKLFIDADENPYSGDVVINNLKNTNPDFSKLTASEQIAAKNAVSNITDSAGMGRPFDDARKWFEKQSAAQAKDLLPELLKEKNYKTINTQMQNFSKTPEGGKAFLQEMGYSMSKMKPDDVRTMWQNIGPSVKEWLVKDPAEFKKIQNMVNEAKNERDVKRLTSVLIRSGYGAYEIREKVKKGEL
jgi:hypothetical protein